MQRGVYALGHAAATRDADAMAAVLAVGEGAALCRRSALALRGIAVEPVAFLEVTTQRRRGHHDGIRVYREALEPVDRTVVRGVPTTTIRRALADLRAVLPPAELARAVHDALTRRLITREQAAVLDPGVPVTRSRFERALLELVAEYGLPRPSMNTIVEGQEVDAVWPDHRLVVELDGFEYHATRHQFGRDRRRDADLQEAGFRVIRLAWEDLADPVRRRATRARLRRLMRHRVMSQPATGGR